MANFLLRKSYRHNVDIINISALKCQWHYESCEEAREFYFDRCNDLENKISKMSSVLNDIL